MSTLDLEPTTTASPRTIQHESRPAAVRSLGYVYVDATDLDAWVRFAADLLGLQVALRTEDRVEFRMDEKEYRLVVERAEQNRLAAIGWEVAGPQELAILTDRLNAAGYQVSEFTQDEKRDRRVTGGVRFQDPDGTADLELHYGLRESFHRFSSPTGASFVTGSGGLGHVFQFVDDWEAYRALYFDLLGFTLSDHIEGGRNHDVELTFLHCNPRHHSFAFGHIDGVAPGIGHLMIEVSELDVVGMAWDKVDLKGAAPIVQTLGMHTNDRMVSFYARAPAGFAVEYGTGGVLIDDATWTPSRYPGAHYWGHQRP